MEHIDIDIDTILNQLEFGISNRATSKGSRPCEEVAKPNAPCNVKSCCRPDCDDDAYKRFMFCICVFALKRKENCRLCFHKRLAE